MSRLLNVFLWLVDWLHGHFFCLSSSASALSAFFVWTSRGQCFLHHCLVFPKALRVWEESCRATASWSQANWRVSFSPWETDAPLSDTATYSLKELILFFCTKFILIWHTCNFHEVNATYYALYWIVLKATFNLFLRTFIFILILYSINM